MNNSSFRKHSLALAIGSALLAPFAGHAANGQQVADGVHLDVPAGDYATTADGQAVLLAANGGSIAAIGVDAVSIGAYAPGVIATGAGSTVNFNGGSITTSGIGARGIRATGGGTVNANNVDISTSGAYARGLQVEGAGSHASFTGGSIKTTNEHASAVSAADGGSVMLDSVNVHVSGPNSDAIWAQKDGSIVVRNSNIVADGSSVHAVSAQFGTVTLSDTNITTSGEYARGLFLDNGIIDGERLTIETQGARSHGVQMGVNSQLDLRDSDIVTSGDGAIGIWNAGGNASITNSNVITRGANSVGVLVANDGTTNLKDTHVRTEGSGSWGAQVNGTLNVDGGSLVSAQHGAINVTGDAAIALSNGAQAIGGNGTLLSIANEGSLVSLSMDNNVYAEGDIVVVDTNGDGSVQASANVSLANASHWKGASDGSVNQLSLASGSQWTMTGDSMVGPLLLNDSVIAFAAPTVGDFKTLTVVGDFASNGGTLLMNAVLGDDASATDKLHVMGNTSGQANVTVNNVGGVGAQTVDGIQIIQVDGVSNAQFDLSGRAVGGLYEYFLFQGGKADPNDGDWYLRSELPVVPPDPCEVDPNAPGCTPVIPDPCEVDPNAPGCKPIVSPEPILRPEVGAYLANQSAAVGMFQHAMHDRLGEPNLAERLKNDDTLGSAWVRVERNQADYGAVEGQIGINSDSSLLQIGTDIAQWGQTGRGQIGIMAATGQANSTATSALTGYTAKGKVEGTALGVYGTWFARPAEATGLYVDAWVQAGRYKNSVHGEGLAKESYDAETLTGSVEAGYAWKVYADDAKAFYLEPQAQVIYTDYRSDDHVEVNGTVASVEEAGGLTTRLGLRAYGHATSAQGNRVQPFVTANWYHQSKDNTMGFDGEALMGGVPQDRYELKVGAQLQLGGGWTGWGHLGVQSGANDYRNVGGQLGLKYSW